MKTEIYEILDELAARGRRLRGELPGDYKPVAIDSPTANALAQVLLYFPDGEFNDSDFNKERNGS